LPLQKNNENEITEKDIHVIKDQHLVLKKKLVNANDKYNKLKNDLRKELKNLKDANQHELNFFIRNHKALKVRIIRYQTQHSINY